MKRFVIEADPRLLARRVHTATKRDAIRALIELITNCDDSYRRLEEENLPATGRIEILYDKQGHRCCFAVRDEATGMSYEEICNAFEKYGAATSGYKEGKAVSGFFGTGAKNALGGMTDGKICTFKDDTFTECRIFFGAGELKGEIDDPRRATARLRSKHGISGNGTIAYFVADPEKNQRVPRFDTVHESLANHWRLRTIMANRKRKVNLVSVHDKKKRRLRYCLPEGKALLDERFLVRCDTYGEFPVHICLRRCNTELPQDGEDRQGGLLILDEAGAILDMSLFKYDNEPLAARFFGEAVVECFRKLLEREVEEPVLKEEREGLDRSHPVCKAIISEIEQRIGRMVKEEQRRQRQARSDIDSKENSRYRDGFRILNDIADAEAEVENLGQGPSDEIESPPHGFCLYPDSAHITVGKRYRFELRVDTRKVRPGTLIGLESTSGKVQIIGKTQVLVRKAPDTKIVQRYITVQASQADVRAVLRATAKERCTEASIFVEPEPDEKEQLLSEGLVFRPQTLTVRMNKVRKSMLRVYVKVVPGGSKVELSTENENIHVWPQEILVNEVDARRHVAEYEIEVWGDRVNDSGIVTAEHDGRLALLDVRVKTDDEERKKEKGAGMFSEPHFDLDDPEPLQRTSYSPETGSVIIYANFPSVKHYLGEDCCYKKTLAAQILIADLVAERCFLEVARKKVENKGAVLSQQALPAAIAREVQELSKKYGRRVHKALVDQALIQQDRANASQEVTFTNVSGANRRPLVHSK